MNIASILATKGNKVVTIRPEQSIREALRVLAEHNIGALVVVDAGRRPVGILSERDIVRAAARDEAVFGADGEPAHDARRHRRRPERRSRAPCGQTMIRAAHPPPAGGRGRQAHRHGVDRRRREGAARSLSGRGRHAADHRHGAGRAADVGSRDGRAARRSGSRSSAPGRPASTPPSTCCAAPDLVVEVDLFDRLPTPYGLVRAGVAPDHQKIKAVTAAFDKMAGASALPVLRRRRARQARDASPTCARTTTRSSTRPGAQTDRRMGIPGEDLPRQPSRDRVRRLVQRPSRLPRPPVRSLAGAGGRGRRGQRRHRRGAHPVPHAGGAGDAPTSPTTRWRRCARAGCGRSICSAGAAPAQAAFTNPEIKELGELADADVVVDAGGGRAGRAEPGGAREERRPRRRQEGRDPPELRAAAGRHGKPRTPHHPLPRLAGSAARRRDGAVGGIRLVRNRARRLGDRHHPGAGDGSVRGAAGRARVPLGRLPRRAAAGRALRREAGASS